MATALDAVYAAHSSHTGRIVASPGFWFHRYHINTRYHDLTFPLGRTAPEWRWWLSLARVPRLHERWGPAPRALDRARPFGGRDGAYARPAGAIPRRALTGKEPRAPQVGPTEAATTSPVHAQIGTRSGTVDKPSPAVGPRASRRLPSGGARQGGAVPGQPAPQARGAVQAATAER